MWAAAFDLFVKATFMFHLVQVLAVSKPWEKTSSSTAECDRCQCLQKFQFLAYKCSSFNDKSAIFKRFANHECCYLPSSQDLESSAASLESITGNHDASQPEVKRRSQLEGKNAIIFLSDMMTASPESAACIANVTDFIQTQNTLKVFLVEEHDDPTSWFLGYHHPEFVKTFNEKLVVLNFYPDIATTHDDSFWTKDSYSSQGFFYFQNSSAELFSRYPTVFGRHCVTVKDFHESHGRINTIAIPFKQNQIQKSDVDKILMTKPFSFRPVLMHHQANLHGKGSAIRLELYSQCERFDKMTCSYSVGATDHQYRTIDKKVRLPVPNVNPMDVAKFTLNPPGDDASRATVVKSMMHGSVPVIFSSCSASMLNNSYYGNAYPMFLGTEFAPNGYGAGAWAVILNYTEVFLNNSYVVDELKAINESTFNQIQSYGRKLLFRNLYATEPLDGIVDAVDVIVSQMATYPDYDEFSNDERRRHAITSKGFPTP